VRATALQNALIAAAIAERGTEMTPDLLSTVVGPDGTIVRHFTPTAWLHPMTASQSAQIVPLMRNVVRFGTASESALAADDVAAKTGTAQTGNAAQNTDDWMIAFAPAAHPTVAVAVVIPTNQSRKPAPRWPVRS
jgi:peptidoglycan glycosyltransferase